MYTIKELRQQQYDYHLRNERFSDLNDWRKSPYTFLKARFYMNLSAVLVRFLLMTGISPNTVTIVYIFLGVAGGVLLALPFKAAVVSAIIIFFTRGILDWSDGHLARITNRTSATGDILDLYGAVIGAVCFQTALGFYVARRSGQDIFYFLIPLIPFFYFGRLHYYAFSTLFRRHITPEKIDHYSNSEIKGESIEFSGYKPEAALEKKYGKIYGLVKNLFDDRARSVDLALLLLALEMVYPVFITQFMFLGYLLRQSVIFAASFYIIAKGEWAEKQLENKSKVIAGAFLKSKCQN